MAAHARDLPFPRHNFKELSHQPFPDIMLLSSGYGSERSLLQLVPNCQNGNKSTDCQRAKNTKEHLDLAVLHGRDVIHVFSVEVVIAILPCSYALSKQ